MKIRHLIFIIALALNFCFLAQTEFTPGLYLVKKGATYAQEVKNNSIYYPYSPKNPSSYGKHTEMAPSDELVVTTENGDMLFFEEKNSITEGFIGEGSVVSVTMMINKRIYCFDLYGNMFVFSSMADLTPVPKSGYIGRWVGEVEQLPNGPDFCCDQFYWILNSNIQNGTVKIQLPMKTVDLNESNFEMWQRNTSTLYGPALDSKSTIEGEVEIRTVN